MKYSNNFLFEFFLGVSMTSKIIIKLGFLMIIEDFDE